jgi:hypothetical protein
MYSDSSTAPKSLQPSCAPPHHSSWVPGNHIRKKKKQIRIHHTQEEKGVRLHLIVCTQSLLLWLNLQASSCCPSSGILSKTSGRSVCPPELHNHDEHFHLPMEVARIHSLPQHRLHTPCMNSSCVLKVNPFCHQPFPSPLPRSRVSCLSSSPPIARPQPALQAGSHRQCPLGYGKFHFASFSDRD